VPAVVDVAVDSNGAFVRGDANGDIDAVISADAINGTATKQFVLAVLAGYH
jgi:hypothetical protein